MPQTDASFATNNWVSRLQSKKREGSTKTRPDVLLDEGEDGKSLQNSSDLKAAGFFPTVVSLTQDVVFKIYFGKWALETSRMLPSTVTDVMNHKETLFLHHHSEAWWLIQPCKPYNIMMSCILPYNHLSSMCILFPRPVSDEWLFARKQSGLNQ